MRFIWPIFKKDAQRLVPEAAVSIGLLVWWAHQDRWRWGFTPSATEGWLGILLPFAWAYLIGLLVLQDPLVGDRQFWVTLPVRWRSVLAAKALFALIFIHLPYFAAEVAVLGFRDLQPFFHLPHVLWKQFLLLAVIVLPAAAVAAVVRNAVQFTLAAVLVAAAVIFLYTSGQSTLSPFVRLDDARLWLALVPAFAGAVTIVLVQYRGRRTAIARVTGLVAAVGAIVVYTWLPPTASAAFHETLYPARDGTALTFTLTPPQQPVPRGLRMFGWGGQAARFALPYEIGGLPPDALVSLTQVGLEIHAARGEKYGAAISWNRSRKVKLFASLWHPGRTPYRPGTGEGGYLVLLVDPALSARLRSAPVTLKGSIIVSFRHRGSQASLAVGTRADVPGVGKCSSAPVSATYMENEMLKVNCESAGDIPNPTHITLADQVTGREWRQRLGDAMTSVQYPRTTWLSPINHRDTFFHITSEEVYQSSAGSHWTVPRNVLATARIQIRPEFPAGSTIIGFDLTNVSLTSYELPAESVTRAR